MKQCLRVVAFALLGVGAASAGVAGQSQPTTDLAAWSEIEIPGTPDAFARAAGLNAERLGPEWVILECARVRSLIDVSCGFRTNRMPRYFEAFAQLRDALAPLLSNQPESKTVSLKLVERDRKRFQAFAESIGLKLSVRQGVAHLTRSTDRAAVEARTVLIDAGVELEGVEEQLNAGESVQVKIPTFRAALPMDVRWWRDVVFKRNIPADDFAYAIVSDPKALFLYYGLASMDSDSRAQLATKVSVVSKLYNDHAGLFATYGGHVRIRDGRIDVPGGYDAIDFWETLVREKVVKTDRFIETLFSADEGRLAYFYEAIDALDPARVRFALGLQNPSTKRSARDLVDSLYGWFNIPDTKWTPDRYPFTRPNFDPSLLLEQIAVGDNGRPIGPAWRYLWNVVFNDSALPDRPEKLLKPRPDVADAPYWIDLVYRKANLDPRDRLETLLFAQRVFGDATEPSAPDILLALRGFARFRMLSLALERMGVRAPAVYAAAVRRAAQLSEIRSADVALVSLSQFQGALALIEHGALTQRLSVEATAELVTSLVSVELSRDGSYGAGIALWLDRTLIPGVATRGASHESVTAEQMLFSGIANLKTIEPTAESDLAGLLVEWEGWQYRIDLPQGLFDRITKVRERQGGNSLDVVLTLARVVESFDGQPTNDDVAEQLVVIKELQKTLQDLKPTTRLTDDKVPTATHALADAAKDLARVKNAKQVKNAVASARTALEPLAALATADVLREIAYALDINDPDTSLLVGGGVSHRHDFGLAAPASADRERSAWGLPDPQSEQGAFHLKGSLLGLDIALADLALRRATQGMPPEASMWQPVDRKVYTRVLALFNPFDARLTEAPAVVSALKKGREQVARALAAGGGLGELADRARVGPLRRSILEWTLNKEPRRAERLFSMVELLRLGGGEESFRAAEAWGAPAITLSGCLCLELGPPVAWEAFSGRQGEPGLLAARSPDLLLRIAELVVDLKLPAALTGELLPFGVRATLDESRLNYVDDWLAIMQQTAGLSQRTFEDYVSRAMTAGRSVIPVSAIVK